ncbi:MAG: hypothetical protein K2X27_16145 [Candidatus Obscuribacterales bacterium]|nr:hypothetical protein [Candidatus Obscuribacterales bacterium]
MINSLKEKFQKMGAKLEIVPQTRRNTLMQVPVIIDVIEERGHERFQISLNTEMKDNVDLTVLEIKKEDRHLLLLSRRINDSGEIVKEHFLCGHDERHWFVAAVNPVSTVDAAKDSLKPEQVRDQESGQNSKKRNRRKTPVFKRQGEWFFLPIEGEPKGLIRRDEPISRNGGSKAHIAQFACRISGENVMVCRNFPNGVTEEEYARLIKADPKIKGYNWQSRARVATVYAKGRISHPDHATIVLDTWHQVLMNTERRSVRSVAFLD